MKQIKILMIYIEPTPYIFDLVTQLRIINYANIDVFFITTDQSQQWNLTLNEENYNILPSGFFAAIKIMRKKMAENNYSLIHLAGWGNKILLFSLIYGWLRGIAVAVESDTPIRKNQSAYKKAIKRLIMPLIFKLPKLFLPGGSEQKLYFRHYGVAERNISIVNMTVDIHSIRSYLSGCITAKFTKKKYGIGNNDFVFLYVGRLEPHKGIIDLLTAFEYLSERYENMKLLVVGDGSLNNRVRVAEERCPALRYTGRLSGDALLDIFGISTVLVLPSYFEPWGLVINEAMAANLPVIVSERVGCKTDLVYNKETGLIIEAESIIALQNAMILMYENNSQRRKYSDNANKIINDWTKENEARRIHSAWIDTIQTNRQVV